jgi:FlaA1/EpsC-like NDP-sugar epimerase
VLIQIHSELKREHGELAVIPFLGDIVDVDRVMNVFMMYKPDIVFHAAAHKHVPLMELNPGEAIKNNVIGTKILVNAADRFNVGTFVLISTDKAVNPLSIMGASKRMAEIYIQAMSKRSSTKFIAVRFGNVLDSAGSVIPIFREQIQRGGPVTVTHQDMQRYFMTIPEACQLVMQAGTMGEGGEIFALNMGEQVYIVELARDLIRLSGFTEEDISIEFTGVRPGEKLFEELSTESEAMEATKHPKIFIGKIDSFSYDRVVKTLADLESIAVNDVSSIPSARLQQEVSTVNNNDEIREVLRQLIPELRDSDNNMLLTPLASTSSEEAVL